MVGAGTEVLRGFGAVLLLAAAASVFVGLVHAVREREPDLAMLRMLGAPPWRVATLVLAEALLLALLGLAIGLALGHGLTALLGWQLARDRSLHVTGCVVVLAAGLAGSRHGAAGPAGGGAAGLARLAPGRFAPDAGAALNPTGRRSS